MTFCTHHMDEPVNNFFDNSPLLQQLFLWLDLALDFLQVPANQVRLAQTSIALCNSNVSPATTAFPFLIIIKNAFLTRQIPLWLYTWGSRHYTSNITRRNVIKECIIYISLYPHNPTHKHLHTQSHFLCLSTFPFCKITTAPLPPPTPPPPHCKHFF